MTYEGKIDDLGNITDYQSKLTNCVKDPKDSHNRICSDEYGNPTGSIWKKGKNIIVTLQNDDKSLERVESHDSKGKITKKCDIADQQEFCRDNEGSITIKNIEGTPPNNK